MLKIFSKKSDKTKNESDLDLDFDFNDFDDVFADKKEKNKGPIRKVFSGTIAGISRTATSSSFLAQTARDVLPKQYGYVFDTIDKTAGTLSGLYNEAVKEIKPQARNLAKQIDKMIPEENALLKKYSTKLKNLFGEEYSSSYDSSQAKEDTISNALAQVFVAKSEQDIKDRVYDKSENLIKSEVDSKRFVANATILGSINQGVQRLASYTDKIDQAYKRKSLELQYRSLFAQTELLDISTRFFEISKIQQDAIVNNTALPDADKVSTKEKLKKGLFNIGKNVLDPVLDKLKDKVKTKISEYGNVLQQGVFGLESAADAASMARDAGVDKYTLAGEMGGDFIAKLIRDKLAPGIKNRFSKQDSQVAKFGHKALGAILDYKGTLKDIQNKYITVDYAKDSSGKQFLKNVLNGVIQPFTEDNDINSQIENKTAIGNLNETSRFDNKAASSINVIIPGFLARIYRELQVTRTGNPNIPLTDFDHKKERFTSSKKLGDDIKQSLGKSMKSYSFASYLDKLVDTLTNGEKLSEGAEKALRTKIVDSAIKGNKISQKTLRREDFYRDLDQEYAVELKEKLAKTAGSKEAKTNSDILLQQETIARSLPDVKEEIQRHTDAGYGKYLRTSGLVKKDSEGKDSIDDKTYVEELVKNNPREATSDFYAKEDIKPTETKGILDKVKKLNIFDWKYKNKAKEGSGTRTGPMAQQVHKELGEKAAPGGRKIDLVTLNGINTAAIQEVDKKVEEVKKEGKPSAIIVELLTKIEENTRESNNKLTTGFDSIGKLKNITSKAGSKINADKLSELKKEIADIISTSMESIRNDIKKSTLIGSIKDKFSKQNIQRVIKSSTDLAIETTAKVKDAIITAGTFTKDKIITPIKDKLSKKWDENKDDIKDKAKWLMDSGFDIVKKTYELSKKTLFEHIPEGMRKIKDTAKATFDKFLKHAVFIQDAYLPGQKEPVIRASLLKVGFYVDKKTKKVIETLKDITGTVIDKEGNIILSAKDLKQGLFDKRGKPLDLTFKGGVVSLGNKIFETAKTVEDKARKFLVQGYNKVQEKFNGVKAPDINIPNLSMGNKQLDNLVTITREIRDILRKEFKVTEPNSDSVTMTSEEYKKSGQFIGPEMPQGRKLNLKAQEAKEVVTSTMTPPAKSDKPKRVRKPKAIKPIETEIPKQSTITKAEDIKQIELPKIDVFEPVRPTPAQRKAAKSKIQEEIDKNTKLIEDSKLKIAPGAVKQEYLDEESKEIDREIEERKTSTDKKQQLEVKKAIKPERDKAAAIIKANRKARATKKKDNVIQIDTNKKISPDKVLDTLSNVAIKSKTPSSARKAQESIAKLIPSVSETTAISDQVNNKQAANDRLFSSRLVSGGTAVATNVPAPVISSTTVPSIVSAPVTTGSIVQETRGPVTGGLIGRGKNLIGRVSKSGIIGNIAGRVGGTIGAIGNFLGIGGSAAGGDNTVAKNSSINNADKETSDQALNKANTALSESDALEKKANEISLKSNTSGVTSKADVQASISAQEAAINKRRESFTSNVTKASTEAKYTSGKSILDGLMGKASGAIGAITEGLSMLSDVFNLKKAPGLGKAGGLLKNLGTRALGLAGLGSGVSTAAAATGTAAASGAASAAGTAAAGTAVAGQVAGATAATGAAGATAATAASGILSTIGAILSSPVTLTVAAVAGTAYGVYKLVKFARRDNASDLDWIRLLQYGIARRDKDKIHIIYELENYLIEKALIYPGNVASLEPSKLNLEDILKIFSIVKTNNDDIAQFGKWFNARFKPVFLTHATALYKVNPKLKLNEVNDLETKDQLAYLQLVEMPDGPYNAEEMPFPDLKSTYVGFEDVKLAVDRLKVKLQKELKIDPKKDVDKTPAPVLPSNTPKQENKTDPDQIKKDIATPTNTNKNPAATPDFNGEEGTAPKDAAKTTASLDSASVGKIPLAKGPLSTGREADQYIKLGPDVSLDGMNPEALKNFRAMAQEYGELTGSPITVNSGVRSTKKQEELFKADPTKAARPGTSLHEYGLALDINSKTLDELENAGLMRKYGFTRPVGGESWHMEPAGIQVNLNRAKSDLNFANQAITASLGKGGGGAGTIASEPKGKRNIKLAMNLLNEGLSSDAKKENTKPIDNLVASPGGLMASIDKLKTEVTDRSVTGTNNVTARRGEAIGGQETVMPDRSAAAARDPVTMPANNIVIPDRAAASKRGYAFIPGTSPDIESKAPVDASKISNPASKDPKEIKAMINQVAKASGVDPNIMQAFAAMESGFNPEARASTSSAAGLFQFTSGTWNEMVAKEGAKLGVTKETSRTDPKANALMGAAYLKKTINAVKTVKPDINITDAYLGHFLGQGGVKTLLKAPPDTKVAEIMPKAANANKSLFFKNGSPLTVSEFYNNMSNNIKKKTAAFGINVSTSKLESTNASPDVAPGTEASMEPVIPKAANATNTATTKEQTVPKQSEENKQQQAATYTPRNVPDSSVQKQSEENKQQVVSSERTVSKFIEQNNKQQDIPKQRSILGRISSEILDKPKLSAVTPPAFIQRNKPIEQGSGFDLSKLHGSMGDVGDTLNKSLDVQTKMLEVLKDLANKVDPSKLKEIMDQIKPQANQQSQQKQSSPKGSEALGKPAVDLGRVRYNT